MTGAAPSRRSTAAANPRALRLLNLPLVGRSGVAFYFCATAPLLERKATPGWGVALER